MDYSASLNLVVISAATSVVFFLAWRHLGRKPKSLSWFLASAAAFVAALTSFVLKAPSDAVATACAVCGMAAASFYLQGHGHRAACRPILIGIYPGLAIASLSLVGLTVSEGGTRAAAILLAAFCALAFFLSASLVVLGRGRTRPDEWLSASVVLLLAGLFVGQVVALLQGNAVSSSPLIGTAVAVAILTVLTIASDLAEEMHELATSDQLTGLLNRRGFSERAAAAYADARLRDGSVSVVMSDIDRFKQINDAFGHAAGDLALQHFARALRQDLDGRDIAARVGGEEFALVLPDIGLERALDIAVALCDRIETTPLVVDGKDVPMTASFGVATLTKKDTCLTDVILRADRALYRSKRDGRNRVDLESSQVLRVLRTCGSEAAVKEA